MGPKTPCLCAGRVLTLASGVPTSPTLAFWPSFWDPEAKPHLSLLRGLRGHWDLLFAEHGEGLGEQAKVWASFQHSENSL